LPDQVDCAGESMNTQRIEHLNVKVFAEWNGAAAEAAVPVFHRWIQEDAFGELLVDVAEYLHVEAGPGVILIGHHANYSLDFARNRPGMLYNRKTPLGGEFGQKLQQAYYAALRAAERLEQEPEFQGRVRFHPDWFEVIVNDRLLAPNTDSTWAALRPEIEHFARETLGMETFDLRRRSGPRERFAVEVRRL